MGRQAQDVIDATSAFWHCPHVVSVCFDRFEATRSELSGAVQGILRALVGADLSCCVSKRV